MKLSYAICVCNESRDLYSLISFLKKVIDPEDEINILIDTKHVTQNVRRVIDYFKDDIVTFERDFDGKFAAHRNYHISKCTGDFIFMLDPDEMPKEKLIKYVKRMLIDMDADLLMVPRINISRGFTQEWIEEKNFVLNEVDWINWPDYMGRVFKNCEYITYGRELHEVIIGAKKPFALKADPTLAVWHIKSVEKDDNRWTADGELKLREDENLYDDLM